MFLADFIFLAFWFTASSAYCNTSSFPDNFKFGAGTSAYQVEGAWNEDGKGRSFFDWFFNLDSSQNGNTATDFYHKYKKDVALMQEIGLDYFRFSISWSRILPKGFDNEINQAGVDFYNNLLDELEAVGIEPMVTIYHWDTPMVQDNLGAWTNPKIVDDFVAFADLVFTLFGNRVKLWATLNEPRSFCYLIPFFRQLTVNPELPLGIYEYLCGHHVILAHAKTYRLYQRKYKFAQKGSVGIALDYGQNIPLTNSTEDLEAVKRANAFDLGWFADPIFYGDYPQIMKYVIAKNSANQNFTKSRLPTFSIPEKVLIRGTYDFFMLNTYSPYIVTTAAYNNTPSYANDKQITSSYRSNWLITNGGYAVVPEGVRGTLNYIKDTYRDPQILITEHGLADYGQINDTFRINYLQEVFEQIRLAMCEDGVKLTHFTYWSLLDSFEWASFYVAKYGLISVDFNSTDLTRTLKKSSFYYRNLIETRVISSDSLY